MFITSHVLLSLAVFGPRPEVIIGTILPDTFDYINWIYHRQKKIISLDLLRKNPELFDKVNNSGLIWEIDQWFHSLFVFFLCLAVGALFLSNNTHASFLLWSYGLHLGVDYLTHTRQVFLYFPVLKNSFSIGIYNFGLKSLKILVAGDLLLLIFAVVRIINF